MAIRLRTVQTPSGNIRVALCAVESDSKPDDVYLDDGDHYALAAKFSRDWYGREFDVEYPVEWAAMDTQNVRNAKEVYVKIEEEQNQNRRWWKIIRFWIMTVDHGPFKFTKAEAPCWKGEINIPMIWFSLSIGWEK